MPSLPWRAFALALFAVMGSVYALARHYARPVPAAPPVESATVREIPAPDLLRQDP